MKRWIGVLIGIVFWTSVSHAASVQLSWVASSPTTGVVGYRIYYGTSAGDYTLNVNAGLQTTGTVGGLTPGTTYYMAVRAYTATNQESTNSNEVTVPITVVPPVIPSLTSFIVPQMHSR